MYPLGLASPKEEAAGGEEEFFFLMKEDICLGHKEVREFTVREWIENQGISEYDEFGRLYKEITLHDFFEQGNELKPEQLEMFFTALYDLDKFREFVFESTFLRRFKVERDVVQAMEKSDEDLLRFAFRWLRFCLFGEKTLEILDSEPKGKTAQP
jgi:hypothetical protein